MSETCSYLEKKLVFFRLGPPQPPTAKKPVFDGLEFKPHLGGHWDKAHYSRGVLHGARALTSNRMLPHCGFEGLCTLGLRQ